MRTLYIHAGHGKTGSSFIQSMLAASVRNLAIYKILYRVPGGGQGVARGAISSGNGHLLMEALDGTVDLIFRYRPNVDLLFSREQSMREFGEPGRIKAFRKLIDAGRFDRVEILLFIRNPISHAASHYQQSVKRGGRKNSVEAFFRKYKQPCYVQDFLEAFEQVRDTRVTVRNYSSGKGELREIIAAWLGVPAALFSIPGKMNINRSLSRSETELQRAFNTVLGKGANFLSTRLCESVPDIEGEHIFPSQEAQRELWDRLEGPINWVNARVEPQHRYVFDCQPADSPPSLQFLFSKSQIDAIASAVADEMLKMQAEMAALRTDPFSLWADKQDR